MEGESKFGRIARIVACVVLVFGALGALLLGPGAQIAAGRVRLNPSAPGGPDQLWNCAQARLLVGDTVDARKMLEDWLRFYAREEGRDWEPLLDGSSTYVEERFELGEGIPDQGFAPWVYRRPAAPPAASAPDPQLGEILLTYARLLRAEDEQAKAAHVVICVLNLWPQDSEVHARALEAFKSSQDAK